MEMVRATPPLVFARAILVLVERFVGVCKVNGSSFPLLEANCKLSNICPAVSSFVLSLSGSSAGTGVCSPTSVNACVCNAGFSGLDCACNISVWSDNPLTLCRHALC